MIHSKPLAAPITSATGTSWRAPSVNTSAMRLGFMRPSIHAITPHTSPRVKNCVAISGR